MYVNGGSVIAVGVIFPVLGTLAVAGRFAARRKHHAGLKVDDWLCLPALIFVMATGALFIYGSTQKTIGYHSPSDQDLQQALDYQEYRQQLLLQLEYIIDLLNPIGTGLIRLSFLFFYRRLFRGRAFEIVSWTMIGVVIAWMTSLTIVHLSMCGTDLPAVWRSIAEIKEKCINTLAFLGLQGITSFVMDLVILAIPFFWIWRLHMPNSQKWAVSSVFLVGLFTVGAGATRMVAGIQVLTYKWGIPQDVLGLKAVNDTIGSVSVWLFWQYVEHGTGMVVCCLPTLKGLVTKNNRTSSNHRLQSWASSLTPRSWRSKHTQPSDTDSLSEDEKAIHRITVTSEVTQYTTPV